jgi:hypothetical protein
VISDKDSRPTDFQKRDKPLRVRLSAAPATACPCGSRSWSWSRRCKVPLVTEHECEVVEAPSRIEMLGAWISMDHTRQQLLCRWLRFHIISTSERSIHDRLGQSRKVARN